LFIYQKDFSQGKIGLRIVGKIIVSTGRGGTGKSTFVALFTRYVDSHSILLIDLDPDESLADMLGVDMGKEGKKTVSDALYDIIEENKRSGQTGHKPLSDLLGHMIKGGDCLYKGGKFALISLGEKLTVGCYCDADDIIKSVIPELAQDYEEVVVDSPAGLEHLNRKITPDIDDLFVILDPSEKSTKHIERIKYVAKGVKISYKHFYLVGNYRFNEQTEEYLRDTGETYLGKIDYDPAVREYNLKGKSLLELPENSPASLSVKKILEKAGYKTNV